LAEIDSYSSFLTSKYLVLQNLILYTSPPHWYQTISTDTSIFRNY